MGWRKLGEWIEDEPIEEQSKPEGRKLVYAIGSTEWLAEQQHEEISRIEAEARREKRRLARVAMVRGEILSAHPSVRPTIRPGAAFVAAGASEK